MKTKKIQYLIRKKDHSFLVVEGAQINLFTATRHIKNDKEDYWVVDHIQSGSRIWDGNSYSEARKIGISFTQACQKPNSSDPIVILDAINPKFSSFLYEEKYKTFEDFVNFQKHSE